MAIALIRLCRHDQKRYEWIKVEEFMRDNKFKSSHDWALLRFWGLIEERPNPNNPKSKSSGEWKITKLGYQFAENLIRVKSHVYLENNKLTGMSEERTSIVEALGKAFDYQELMRDFR